MTELRVEQPGPALVPVDRYIAPKWMALESERLWPKVWQLACSVDHVAEPGDYYEYRVGWLSVVIVRSDDGELRAFQNVCRHRGNSICQGTGTGLTELRCPYHRWSWSTDGRLHEVPSRKWFGMLESDNFGLIPTRVNTWGRLVFINLDLEAEPLAEWLEGVPDDVAWCPVREYRCESLILSPMPANWKVIVDGFSETYHIQGIHREMLAHIDDVHTTQRLWRRHGVSIQQYGVPSPRLGSDVAPEDVWGTWMDNMGTRLGVSPGTPMPTLQAGQTAQDLIAAGLVAHHASRGVDISMHDTNRLTAISQYNLFPNATVLFMPDMISVISARPGLTPDDSQFVLMTLHRVAPDSPRSQPLTAEVPSDTDLGMVMNQDISVVKTVQRGLHQPGLQHIAVANEECRLLNFHRNLDEWLDQ